MTALGLPFNARILYQDEFRNISRRWARGKIDNFIASYVRFSGRRYYQVQAQDPEDQYLAYVPNKRKYEDVNIDIRVMSEGASSGDFRYGMVFRRSGDEYYAFTISPVTKTWYFLKSSSAGLETLREGTDKRIRGLETREALRIETYGSTFLLFINGRFIDWINDPEYTSGEVGLFVETLDNPDALIRFDSIIIWNMPPAGLNPNLGRENCFNTRDDDGDRLIDRADPNCQRLDNTATPLPQPTNTLKPTRTPRPTRTSMPPPTNTPRPPNTPNNPPTNTPGQPIPTFLPPLPTILPPIPTILPPLSTILPPILTILPPLPIMPVRTEPPVKTPIPR